MFRLEMLPANFGDCLWIEYGDPRRPKRILIDGGTGKTIDALKKRIAEVVADEGSCRFELFVVTHVDADHIGGALRLVQQHEALKVTFDDIWFNGYRHLVQVRKEEERRTDELGVKDGEKLTKLLEQGLPWNKQFNRRAIVVRDHEPLPVKTLPGGMKLTILSPTPAMLLRLEEREWEKIIEEEEQKRIEEEEEAALPRDVLGENELRIEELLEPTDPDRSYANGSSIAFVAEFGEKRLLLGADAYADVLCDSLVRYASGRPRFDAFKLPHHGSAANVTNELLAAIDCKTFLVSTNGVQHGHPDREAIARAIHAGGEGTKLYFNYRSPVNKVWAHPNMKLHYGYEAYYEDEGSRITLLP